MYRTRHFVAVTLLAMVLVSLAQAGKDFRPPAAAAATAYPARDEHPQERVTIAADPFETREKAAIFPTDWRSHGFLPVRLVIANGGDQPIALNRMRLELVTANRTRLQPATDEDIYRRISRTKRRGDEGGAVPLPLPRRRADVGVPKEARQEIESAQFRAVAVEPRAAQSGFLFFDIEDVREPLAGAHLYVYGVRDSDGQEFMFFDIPLDKYLQRPAK